MSKCLSTAEDVLVFGKSAESFRNNPAQNINLESNIANLSNDDDLSENLADMSFELEDNTYSKNLEVDPNTNVLDEFKNISQGYRELSDNISVSADYFEDMQNNSSDNKNIEYDEFSNEAYADLIVLKTKVLDHDNTEYFLYYMPLMSCIQNILEISNISQTFALEYEELYKTTKNGKENIYKEQNNRKWWKTTQSTLPTGAKILSIILYADATNCDSLGKSQLHPIYLSLGNIPTCRRNKQNAKQLLGYLPIMKSNVGKEIKRQLFHKCLDIILEPIQTFSEKGTNLLLNNKFICKKK
ncbi:zn-finger domain-containing protein [Gigaspora margarita]|uniref:Zn-finger domain-containing protein n=1 Tax=Gigaspora margarita TaxID=4874 RepID=A0A8H3XAB5_GIGMA|nr:zn-finger domain-containing protein [Gigaspora margarita]